MARLTQKKLDEGLDAVAARDRDVARALDAAGRPKLRKRQPGFEALLRAIVGQQVSIASANAIWGRLHAAATAGAGDSGSDAKDPIQPESILALDDETLRGVGLSRQKMSYGRGLAGEIVSGRLDLDALKSKNDEDAIADLIQVRGIGRWSAEIYLLFALGRADVFPVDDLALMIATERMKGLEARPNRAAMIEIGEIWRPWRGAVAHLLWHYYHYTGKAAAAG